MNLTTNFHEFFVYISLVSNSIQKIIIGLKKMVSSSRIKNIDEIKQNASNSHACPLCGESFEIGVESKTLKQLKERDYYPYPHIHIHGDPLHAMLCYIDANLCIRNISVIRSIEISRDSDTFSQIMKKWTNIY